MRVERSVEMPTYVQRRDLQSIVEIWIEYDVGFPPAPAVRDLEERWKRQWRIEGANSKFFSRRKVFYSAIENRVLAEKKSGAEIALEMENDRKERNFTLDKYRDFLHNQ